MAIIFTDKNARTVLVRAQKRERDNSEETDKTREDPRGQNADEILLDLLSKVPESEFIRTPVKVIE